jgi:hypothetical protein
MKNLDNECFSFVGEPFYGLPREGTETLPYEKILRNKATLRPGMAMPLRRV